MWHDTPEYWQLKAFQANIRSMSKTERLEYLCHMADVWWSRTPRVAYITKRVRRHPTHKLCAVCRATRAYCQHHIIQLQHNGPDTSWNRLPVCYSCHSTVHTWLKPKEQTTDFAPFVTPPRQ